MIYFTSDLHFGHLGILRLCHRPFASVEEMDEALIENWNKKVHQGDTVYIVGDLIWDKKRASEYLSKLNGKKIFLLTTNADHQFEKAGLPTEQVFATQGSYNLIQCKRGCHPKTYYAVPLFRQMEEARKDGRIPTELVPKCPVCGREMTMNLRADDHFVEDENWHAAEDRFSRFLSACMDGNTVLLELGVGFNTPTIIRFPFEKLTREHGNIRLIRLSRSKAMVPASLGERAVGINADMAQSITDFVSELSSAVPSPD